MTSASELFDKMKAGFGAGLRRADGGPVAGEHLKIS